MNPAPRRLSLMGAALAVTLLATSCTGPSPVQVSQPSTERQVQVTSGETATEQSLAHVLVGALQRAGVDARYTEATDDPGQQVIDGDADAVMLGSTQLLTLLNEAGAGVLEPRDTQAPAVPGGAAAGQPEAGMTAARTLDRLRALQLRDLAVLPSATADARAVMTVSAATAERYALRSLNDIGRFCPELALGASAAVVLSGTVARTLNEDYGCTPQVLVPLNPLDDALLTGLLEDRVQVALLDAGDASIPDNALVALDDPKMAFPAQQLTPLLTTKDLGQDAIDAVNAVTRKLDQEQLVGINRSVSGPDALDPKTAAGYWLADHGFGG